MKRLLATLLVGCISWSFAATFTVNNTGDGADANPGNGVCSTSTAGVCTLRAAVQEANALTGADTIVFSVPTNSTITMTTGTTDSATNTNNRRALPITESLTINGSAVPGLTISGGWNGVASSTVGWGIFTAPTSTTASSRTINLNDLRLVNANPGSVSSGSNPGTANSNGGALFVEGGTVNISRVTFDNNTANDGSAFDLEIGTTVNVTNSTFSNGKSRDDGGAVDVSLGATANFTNTTFAYNRAQFGTTTGTSGTGGAVRVDGTASFTYVTLAYNQGGAAGGLDLNGTTNLRNSLIFNNTILDGTVNNCDAAVNNQGNNWTDVSGACGTLNTVTAANLKLSTTLATNTSAPANTGPTQTLALDSTSSVNGVIPTGTDCGAGTGATDQRGVTRAVGAGCEPGAYEIQSSAVITGTIFGDTNRSGVRETGENAFTAAATNITLTNTSTNQTLTTTTTTGAYTFSNIPPGTYNVTATASGYVVTTPANMVTVTTGATTTAADIGLAQVLAPTVCSILYGGGGASGTVGPVFSINSSTGARIANLFTPPVQTSAFARDAKTNRLYYIQNTNNDAAWGYYDFVTGTTVALGTFPKSGGDTGSILRFGFNNQGVGYASISTNNAVYKITPGASTTTVERLGVVSDLPAGLSGDFAVTAANRAWLVSGGRVFRIRLDNLTSVEIVNTNTAAINGVAFELDGNLLLSDTTTVYRLNTATLAFTTVGAFGGTLTGGDLANCVVPALEPNLSVVKTVSPSGSASPGSVLTYTITTTNTGNAVSVNTTLTDAIPANTSYVAGSTTLNGTAVADAAGNVMPYVSGRLIKSPANGSTVYSDGIVSTTAPAVVSFQVRVTNPFPSTATAVSNQGFVDYDSGVSETTITVPSAPTAGGSGATLAPIGNRDFGDVPDGATGTATGNYQTTGSDNGPSHTIVSGLRLGSVVADADDGTLQNAAATADNLTGTNDEEGVSSFPVITTAAAQVVTVPVGVTNTTGAAATLTGYLDFNKDGDFLDTGEQSASVSVAANATSANVIFTTPTGLTAGTTYARFRIGSTASEVASSVGAASSGEVEDYRVTIGSPDLTLSKTHTGSFTRGGTGTYTLTVRNTGDQPTSGATITVTDTLPAGLSVNGGSAGTVASGNPAWTCTSNAASPQIITCSSTAVIATSGSSVFTLNVNVAANAGATSGNSVTNSASVSGGGEAAANSSNNSATDSTATVAPTDLTLAKTHSGDFTVGGAGTYSFTVTNIGGVASSGTITVTDTLPTGLTFVNGSATGTGWSCSASSQTVTCSSSTVIAAAGSSTFSFNVSVGVATAPGTNSVTNTATVSGGGDSNTTNNGANNGNGDPTTVLSPDLTVSKSHTPASFVQGGVGNYLIRVYNNTTKSAVPTSGTITVTDTLPTGLSVPAGAVTLTAGKTVWSCTASGQTASGQVITCIYTKEIPVGSGSNVGFNVNVASPAPASVTNQVTVSGGNEATANAGNNTFNDPTPTVDAGRLTLVKSVRNVTTNSAFGTVGSGKPGDVLEYCVAYSNPGQSPVTNTVVSDTIPTTTTPLTSVADYGSQAVRWRVTAPSADTQNLTAPADTDAGELGAALTVRVGAVPAGGAGDVCFQAQIK